MEQNKKRIAGTGNLGYRAGNAALVSSTGRESSHALKRHGTNVHVNANYSRNIDILKQVVSTILTVSMILVLILVIHTLM